MRKPKLQNALQAELESKFARCVLCKQEVVTDHPDTIKKMADGYRIYYHRWCYDRTHNALKGD